MDLHNTIPGLVHPGPLTIRTALKAAEYFRKQGINVKMMHMKDKDASEIGYDKFYEELKKTKEFSSEQLLLNKINSL